MTTKVPDAITYLVAAFTAAGTLGAATPPVTIYDGPISDQSDQLILWVGVDNIDDPAPAAAESSFEVSGLMLRDETLAIYCVAQAWAGARDLASARTAAKGIVTAVQDVVAADPTLGGTVTARVPGVTGLTWQQSSTDKGASARVLFHLDFKVL